MMRVAWVLLLAAGCGRTVVFDRQAEPPALAMCGDGEVSGAEACDDGNADATDGCIRCVLAECGDGFVQRGVEVCDDGNLFEGDSCASRCGLPGCGDGVRAAAEACDDGNVDDGDACLSSCLPARCGDGFVQRGLEECDDANQVDDDGCDDACHLPVCGDGVREGSEECDLGGGNGDRPAFLVTQPSGPRVGTNPLVRSQTSAESYGYRSASSHTGFEQVGESRIYLFADARSRRLSLVVTHGIDLDSSGQSQPESRVEMDITGIPAGFTIDLSDDPGEFRATGRSTAEGRWWFLQNSDGGALGGLPFPGTWKITVTARFLQGITAWGWVRHDLTRIPLRLDEPITIEAFDVSTFCRKTCVIPRCGDGVLDGGEVCDDGNTAGGDGCAADCGSLR